MIVLVTVGTSLPFDDLIRVVDDLTLLGYLTNVYGQIGKGEYIPKYFKQYRSFVNDMSNAYDKAKLVITACGAGTIMEVAKRGIPMIAVSNPDIIGGHEWELAKKMEELGHLIYCDDVYGLVEAVIEIREKTFTEYVPDSFRIDLIENLLEES